MYSHSCYGEINDPRGFPHRLCYDVTHRHGRLHLLQKLGGMPVMDKFPNDPLEAIVLVTAVLVMCASGAFLWYLGGTVGSP